MKRLLVFTSACMATAAVWAALWPRRVETSPPTPPPPVVVEVRWTQDQIASRVAAVENAKTDEERLAACGELLQIPLSEVPDLLEQVDHRSGRGLSLATKTLLIRWASGDGEAAVNWAWKRFRSDGVWENAFNEIGPAWAAHHPAGFAKWALRAAEKKRSPSETVTLAEAGAAELPLLESATFRKIPLWLVTEDPHLAYQVLRTRGGYSSTDAELPLRLNSAAKVREALLAFDNLDKLDPVVTRGGDYAAKMLLGRWQELDPEDFSRSPYARFVIPDSKKETATVLEKWKSSPPAQHEEAASHHVTSTDVPAFQGDRIRAIAGAWSETDAAATVRWLDSLPPQNAVPARAARIAILAPTDLQSTLDWVDRLPVEERQSSLVPAFDAWAKAHPGKQPEMSGWSETRRRAWSDLEALPPNRADSGG